MSLRFKLLLTACWLFIADLSIAPNDRAVQAADTPPAFAKTVHSYKTVGPLKIQADVYRHADDVKRPVVVWLHGGALIMGSRANVPRQILDLARKEGFVVVSLDYRLAPETRLQQIIEDLKDGLNWVHKRGPVLFNANPSRLVVAGGSAGGYLALMSGIAVDPRPTAIVSYWGFGDVDGDWTTKPNDGYGRGNPIDKEAAWSGVSGPPLTSSNKDNGRGRAKFFLYLKQTGRWINAVSGLDPKTDRQRLTPFCPIRNLSAEFPPTMFLHGTADKDVPVGQSRAMARELKRLGVAHELITIEGGGHGLWGGDRKLIQQAFQSSTEYIRKHLSADTE